MGTFKELVHELPTEVAVMEKLTDLLDVLLESVKTTHPQKFNVFIQQLKDINTSLHFDEPLLQEGLDKIGTYISLADSNSLAEKEFKIDFDKESFNKCDFNFALNYMYHNFHQLYNGDWTKYGELALTWLDNTNGLIRPFYEKLFK